MKGSDLVGWNLRRLRAARSLSQESLGLLAKIEQSYVGRIERGQENPTVSTLEALSAALGVSLSEFFVEPAPGEERAPTMKRGRKAKLGPSE